jgi:hypothetical protein
MVGPVLACFYVRVETTMAENSSAGRSSGGRAVADALLVHVARPTGVIALRPEIVNRHY